MPQARILPEQSRWLTTAGVARIFGVSAQWVRALARQGELPFDWTDSGQRIFHRRDVRAALIARQEAKARSRPARLAAVHVRMLKAGIEPRQLSFLQGVGLRIVARGERSVSDAKVKGAESLARSIEAHKRSFVNRKSAGGRG